MLRVFEWVCLAAFLVGLWFVDPWWLLVLLGLVGLLSVDRVERS